MKQLFLILLSLSFTLSSCTTLKTGLYKHEICGKSPDCFLYEFCKNGKFTYWYSQDVLGSATLTGNWMTSNDTLYLKPDKYIFETETSVINRLITTKDSLVIRVRLLPQYYKGEPDTTFINWLILLDNEKTIFETDEQGLLALKHKPINKIVIRDIAFKYGYKPIFPLKDSVFSIDPPSNGIDIYIADNDSKPFIFEPNDKLVIKGKRLFSIPDKSDTSTRPDKYMLIRRKCGNIKIE